MHRDSPVHYLSLLRANQGSFAPQDFWLISSLLGLGEHATNDSFAKRVGECLRGHERYHEVARVSLVRRLGVANHLRVMDCFTLKEFENAMSANYTCFVNPEGSLTKMSPTAMRFYEDAQDVMKSFANDKKPVQRSISYIAQSGLIGGWCLPLELDQWVQGYFFINFASKISRMSEPSDYVMMSILSKIARIELQKLGCPSRSYFKLARKNPEVFVGASLDPDKLKLTTESFVYDLSGKKIKLKVSGSALSSLVSHGNISYILSELIRACESCQNPILQFQQDDKLLLFILTPLQGIETPAFKTAFEDLAAQAPLLGVTLTHEQDSIHLTYPYDGLSHVNYSVLDEDYKDSLK